MFIFGGIENVSLQLNVKRTLYLQATTAGLNYRCINATNQRPLQGNGMAAISKTLVLKSVLAKTGKITNKTMQCYHALKHSL